MKFNVSVFGFCIAALLTACGGGDPYDAGAHKVKYVAQASNFVGNGNDGYGNGTGNDVQFSNPNAVALSSKGDLYVADGKQIRKVTPAGEVSLLVEIPGTGFFGVAVDSAGNVFASAYTNVIYKISTATPPVVTIFAGIEGSPGLLDSSTPTSAQFNNPKGMAIDKNDNLYIADSGNNAIRKITSGGVVSTVAGNGNGFDRPAALAVDTSGNLYVADTYKNAIRKITPSGSVTTVAGSGVAAYADGTGTAASFYRPQGITIDKNGNLIVADTGNHSIRTVTPTSGVVTTLAGDGETAGLNNGIDRTAKFDSPMGIAVSPGPDKIFYLADNGNRRIRLLKMIWI